MAQDQRVDHGRPLVSVDTVIFTVSAGRLEVLLVQRRDGPDEPFAGRWALPGGFVDVARDADLEACARRKLLEKTGIDSPYLEQLGSWGGATRDPRGWSTTHAYFALLPATSLNPIPGGHVADTRWQAIDAIAPGTALAFDHAGILDAAVRRLRSKVEYTSLPVYLMATEFTLSELQGMYEAILGRQLEKKAFRTRLLSADLVQPVPRMRGGTNRPAQLFKLRPRRGLHFFARPFGSADPP
jgi:ADP-ribose pyrophosphatase YjhB (NUDIX family)